MFDEFREQAEESFIDEEMDYGDEARRLPIDTSQVQTSFFSMTPTQRIFLLALLLIVICLFSALCLLVTGRVVPPIP
jgi:hypothetical protein